jgi:hypothetical protein
VDRVLKILGATLIAGGLTWLFLVLATFAGSLPRSTAWFGGSAVVLGFALLYRYGFRDEARKAREGEWLQATGVVAGLRRDGTSDARMLVRLTCPELGSWTTQAFVLSDAQEALADQRGAPVEALVRSNDRKVVEVVSVGGRSWDAAAG